VKSEVTVIIHATKTNSTCRKSTLTLTSDNGSLGLTEIKFNVYIHMLALPCQSVSGRVKYQALYNYTYRDRVTGAENAACPKHASGGSVVSKPES
jgi:hypothetical protein